jgi:hypothetical protein
VGNGSHIKIGRPVHCPLCPLVDSNTPNSTSQREGFFEETFVFRDVSVLTLFRQESAETIRVTIHNCSGRPQEGLDGCFACSLVDSEQSTEAVNERDLDGRHPGHHREGMCGGRHNLPSQIIGHHDEEATDRATVISALLTVFRPCPGGRLQHHQTTVRAAYRHDHRDVYCYVERRSLSASAVRAPPFWLQAHPSLPHRSGSATGRWATSSECLADSTTSPSALSIRIRSLPVEM